MRRVFDHSNCDTGIVFIENNLQKKYIFDKFSIEMTVRILSLFSEIWCPDFFTLVFAHTDDAVFSDRSILRKIEIKPGQNKEFLHNQIKREIDDLDTDSHGKYTLIGIKSGIYGWSRIVIPEKTEKFTDWKVVCPDNIFPRKYISKKAENVSGNDSIWLKIEDAQHASFLQLDIDDGKTVLTADIGLCFFNPERDMRDKNFIINGVKLENWQKVHLEFLEHIEKKTFEDGWLKHKFYDL